MRELSIFVDESGDFGAYSTHSPYYIVSMVIHSQQDNLEEDIKHLEYDLTMMGFPNHCIHTGPIIRQEEEYRFLDLTIRRKIFNKLTAFAKKITFRYKTFYIEKRKTPDAITTSGKLAKLISDFIKDNYSDFLNYSTIKIYYDNGQIELTKILTAIFNVLFQNIEFKKALPSHYRLFQIADLICTLELLRLKSENHILSNSELLFFGSERELKKNYLRHIEKKSY